MSRNFELMRQARTGIGRLSPSPITVGASDNSATQIASEPPALEESKAFYWFRAVSVLQKHWRLSALFAGLVILTTAGVTFLSKPVYEATARVEVDPSGEKFSLENGGSSATDAEYLETQSQVLQGDSLAIVVIRKLRLDHNPEFVDVDKSATSSASAKPDQLTPEESEALVNFRADRKVRRDTASRLILVSFPSHNPELAAQLSNTLVESFIDQSFQSRHDAVMKSSEWLSRQLDDIRKKIEDSSQALVQFQQASGVTDIDSNKSTFTEHMGELSRQQTVAQAERIPP